MQKPTSLIFSSTLEHTVRACVFVWVHVCVRARVGVHVHACLCVCMRALHMHVPLLLNMVQTCTRSTLAFRDIF